MTEKINIMFLIDSLYGVSGGGTEIHLSYLVKYLPAEHFQCSIVAFDCGDTPFVRSIRWTGIPVIHLPVGKYYTPHALRQAFKLRKLIQRNKTDIVQVFHFKSNTYGALIARLSGVRYVLSSKRDIGDNISTRHKLILRALRGVIDRYIVVADKVGEIIIKDEHASPRKITRIYNGVDVERFHPPSSSEKERARAKLGYSKEDFVVGIVSVFRPEKNHEMFFKAIAMVSEKIHNLKALLVGGGPLFTHYKNKIENSVLGKIVTFTGPTHDVMEYLKAFDVACLVPSCNEGFSNAVLEKMAAGLPLIVTDIGGNAEAVLNGYNGIVIPPCDSDALADAIVRLYEYPVTRKEMGRLSRQRAEKYFTLQGMVQKHEELYKSLMATS